MTVGLFYKWEDHNHGLEHKCGTCATVLSSPRAKKTCFGVHEEVCPAYHKTLHFVGASHNCTACSNTTKAHSKRHHEIAKIIQAIHHLERISSVGSLLCDNKRKSKKKANPNPKPSDDGDLCPGQVVPEPEVEWNSNASTLNNDDDDDAEGKKRCWSGGMESPDARKVAKAERKSAKHQVLFEVITQEELSVVEEALHGQSQKEANVTSKGQGLADNQTIDDNIVYNPNTFKWGQLRQGVHAKKIAKMNEKVKPNTPEQDNKILNPIFAQLGIRTNISKANRERKTLDSKLRAAILRDLVAFENDQVETMQRMAGYWRYANRRTYNEMVRNNELWDWATGEKLPEMTEEAELEVIEEEEEAGNAEAGTEGVKMDRQVPENWDDPEHELLSGMAPLSLALSDDRSNSSRNIGGSGAEPDGEVGSIGDCITIPELHSSLEHLSRQNSSSSVLSPLSGDETWKRLHAESIDHINNKAETFNDSFTSRTPLSPMNANPKDPHGKAFYGVKDARVFGKAIRNASPPPKDTPQTPRLIRNLSITTTTTTTSSQNHDNNRDPRNRFGALAHEVPAPCDEVKKVDPTGPVKSSVIRIPAKPIVKTLVMHDEKDDWETIKRPRGNNNNKKGGIKDSRAVALRDQAAGNVHAWEFAKGGKSFAAVVKRGL